MLFTREKHRLLEYLEGQLDIWQNMTYKEVLDLPYPAMKPETIEHIQQIIYSVVGDRIHVLENEEIETLVDMIEFKMTTLFVTGYVHEYGIMDNVRVKLNYELLKRMENN